MNAIMLLPGLVFFSITTFAATEKPASAVAKELIFPITGKSNIGSYWGDTRDGGARKHEGIDIFASKGTPVVAVTDGYVLEVTEDGIGGKSVTIQSDDYSWRSYYAHLDEQKVVRGQVVKKGQLIGTVGNTGNAKTTPAHLHFGIYDGYGAIDPLPYVKTSPKIAAPVKAGPTVYKQSRSAEPTVAKSVPKKGKLSPVLKTAAVNILTGIFSKKIRGVLN
jgi:murein DD-endopeptidase MepM/ murein hydrolase activator NlpD